MQLNSASSKVAPEGDATPTISLQQDTTPSGQSVQGADEKEVPEGATSPERRRRESAAANVPGVANAATCCSRMGSSTRSLMASAAASLQTNAVAGLDAARLAPLTLRRSIQGSSKGSSSGDTAEDMKRKDLENFRPSVRRRVRTQELARTSLSVRILLLMEEREDHWAAGGVRLVVTAVVFASTILLGLRSAEPSDDGINRADLGCAAFLLAEWLIRFVLHITMRCSAMGGDAELGELAAHSHAPWLFIDGVASLSHSATAVAALWFGHGTNVTGFSVLEAFRLLRLLSLVRYSPTLDLIAAVMKQSLYALKGPMYLLGVSAVYVAAAIYYAEQLGSSSTTETTEFRDMFDALWFSWVTFSTVGYGDYSPLTPMGKLITMLGIGIGMLWFAMPISIVGSTFTEEWHRRNVRRVSDALQTELLQQGLMTNGLHKKFLEIDEDGSGTLDEEEFTRFLKNMSQGSRMKYIGPTEARAMFSMMDPDHGGTISYKELVRVVFPGIDITSHLFWKTNFDDADTSHARHGTRCGKLYMQTRPKSCKDMFKKAMMTSETAMRLEQKRQSATAAARTRVAPIGGSSPQSSAGPSAEPEKAMELTSREVIGALREQVQQLQAGQENMLARLEAVATAVDKLTEKTGGSIETIRTIVDAE